MRTRHTLLALLLFASPAAANNTGGTPTLLVTKTDGKAGQGKVKFKKKKLEVRGLGKIRYGDVAELTEALPLTGARLVAAQAEFEKRKAKLSEDDAKGWARLGQWAAKRDLDAETREAFETVIEIDPDHAEARLGLGQMKADAAWVDAAREIEARRARIKPENSMALMDLAKLATKSGARAKAFDLLAQVLARDSSNKRGLKLLRPLTNDYRQQTRLSFPLSGRVRISEDRTRHHQHNVSAIYSLDLAKVDEEGNTFRGRGKKLENYLAWDQPFYAAADGEISWVQNDFPDLPPGVLGRGDRNNGVGIRHGNNETTWYFHAVRGSITLKVGDQVKRGQLLGRVGNSGKANIPHLHFALAWRGYLGVPWRVEGLEVVAPEGTRIPAKDVAPREGWIVVAPEPKPLEAEDEGKDE